MMAKECANAHSFFMEKYMKKTTYTKKWLSRILVFAIVDIQLSYVLAFLGQTEIAETLSITIVTEVIGVMLGYFAKSYFETKEEKRVALQERQMKDIYDRADNDETEAVG